MRKNQNISPKVLIIIVAFLGVVGIGVGLYLGYLSNPKRIMGSSIDKLNTEFKNITQKEDTTNIGENFTATSNIKFNLEGDYLKSLEQIDSEYSIYSNLIKNLSNTDNKIIFTQDKENKKLLLQLISNLNSHELISTKYLIENNTEYYYINGYTNSYINNGTNNYFESLNEDITARDNFNYLYDFVNNSLKNNLKDEYFTKTTEKDSTKVSLKLNNNICREIISNVLNDLKKDKKASKILTSYNKNFSKTKIKNNQKFLEENEEIEVNIYTDKILYSPKKYELIVTNNKETQTITYQKEKEKKIIEIKNPDTSYKAEITNKDRKTDILIKDSENNNIGTIKITKTDTTKNIVMNLKVDNIVVDFTINSKNTNINSKKEYTNNMDILLKITSNDMNLIDFKVNINTKVTNISKIDEDISTSILKSSITDAQKDTLNKKLENIFVKLTN